MEKKILTVIFVMVFVMVGMSYAADDPTSLGDQAASESLGGQAGEAVRELKDTADENYATGMTKVGEASRKMEADARDTLKTLQEQWNILAQQLQEKTKKIQTQLQQQWRDFNKSFNQPKQ